MAMVDTTPAMAMAAEYIAHENRIGLMFAKADGDRVEITLDPANAETLLSHLTYEIQAAKDARLTRPMFKL